MLNTPAMWTPPLVPSAAFALALGLPVVASASEFVGASRCRDCHAEAYAQWRQTAHARATETLPDARRRDPRCVGCHATSPREGLLGVQCESCHGAGRDYARAEVMRDPGLARATGLRPGTEPAVCARCHTADTAALTPFDSAAAMVHVRHRAPGERP
jgi:hypothetical protein